MNTVAAVIIGGHVNGYSIIRELHACGVKSIILIDTHQQSIASWSRYITKRMVIDQTKSFNDSLQQTLERLHKTYTQLVLFPTHDKHLVALEKLEKTISSYCTIPTNTKTIQTLLSKQEQYKIAKTCGVHTPQTLHIKTKQDLNRAAQIPLPCIIKPLSSQTSELFRILDIQTEKERKQCFDQVLTPAIQNGHEFIASELIPGADNQIAAYVCFVTPDKQILGAYTGRKHTQCPENFGVFASAETEDIPELHTLGKKLVEGMNIHGIIEPEFKYDERDQTWKLMEVNFRSMMWNRVGWYQGVPLAYLQYCSATNTNPQISIKKNPTRIVYLRHQLRNLVHRPSYFSLLLAQYRKPWKPVIWNISDPLPGIYDTIYTLLILTKTICLKYFRS